MNPAWIKKRALTGTVIATIACAAVASAWSADAAVGIHSNSPDRDELNSYNRPGPHNDLVDRAPPTDGEIWMPWVPSDAPGSPSENTGEDRGNWPDEIE